MCDDDRERQIQDLLAKLCDEGGSLAKAISNMLRQFYSRLRPREFMPTILERLRDEVRKASNERLEEDETWWTAKLSAHAIDYTEDVTRELLKHSPQPLEELEERLRQNHGVRQCDTEDLIALRKRWECLREDSKAMLSMHWNGFLIRSISERFDCSEATVRRRFREARHALGGLLR